MQAEFAGYAKNGGAASAERRAEEVAGFANGILQCGAALSEFATDFGLAFENQQRVGESVVGDDVAGVAVHIGARVSALAVGGEVLVSSTVKDLVAGSGIEFNDRGDHQLKGVPGSWHLYTVVGLTDR